MAKYSDTFLQGFFFFFLLSVFSISLDSERAKELKLTNEQLDKFIHTKHNHCSVNRLSHTNIFAERANITVKVFHTTSIISQV